MLLSLEHVRMNKDEAEDSIANWVRFGILLTKNWEVISKWAQNLETDVIMVKEVKKFFQRPGSLMGLSLFFLLQKAIKIRAKRQVHLMTLANRFVRRLRGSSIWLTSRKPIQRSAFENLRQKQSLGEKAAFVHCFHVSGNGTSVSLFKAKDPNSMTFYFKTNQKLLFHHFL